MFDRNKLYIRPLHERKNKSTVETILDPHRTSQFPLIEDSRLEKIAREIKKARENNRPVILTFGAHLVKNGLSLIVVDMIKKGYITHLATNGAAPIHDWEIAYQGKTEENVRYYLERGQFGLWEETGKYMNLALIVGALENKGYGESLGAMINDDTISIPKEISQTLKKKLEPCHITFPSTITVSHPHKNYSFLHAAYVHQIQVTIHPHFGHDIIYTHPVSDGASIGTCAEIDFLKFTQSVSELEGGVYLSVGSSIMSPMIFEKALSMARNVAFQNNQEIKDFMIVVNDIQDGDWDWNSNKEPSKEDPAYYLRFCKTFHRAGARELHYIQADNRDFLLNLYRLLSHE